jgi:cysteine desulfurase
MKVYLDNASTTQVHPAVFEAMVPYFHDNFGNPSSLHDRGIQIRKDVNLARQEVARLLHCQPNEVHFTSCGTEASNWALKGLAFANHTKGEIITTKTEHHATLHAAQFLEELGYIVHYLDVDAMGFVDLDQLRRLISDNTLVVSILLANNEIGTIQRLDEISRICEDARVYLHVDAVQAITHIPIDLSRMNVDLMSISGHKFHAPKGIGALYIKDGTHITNLLHGGQQEHGLRSGTENVPYIIGFATALRLGLSEQQDYESRLDRLAKRFLATLDDAGIDYRLNGPPIGPDRLPGNLNLSFRDVDGQDLVFYLNKEGVEVSTGSACDSTSIEPSHVLQAIRVPAEYIDATIRVSIGTFNTEAEIDYASRTLIRILRNLS